MSAAGTLYGSLTSPYSRLTRLVRTRTGADSSVGFEKADPFDAAFREVNPLGKVPALRLANGTLCLETTQICRALMMLAGEDLLPEGMAERIEAEADVAFLMGVLDLGVAHRLEMLRPKGAQSPKWQDRRLEGLAAALPGLEQIGRRAAREPKGLPALALVSTADWLSFRMDGIIDWRAACPGATETVDRLLTEEDVAATDPRLA